jgi:tRNA threonylcarbamoyladenosine biosynthesis protein TsaE
MSSILAKPDQETFALPDAAATDALGARIAGVLAPGLKIYLSGDLGAGKTALTRAVLRASGIAGRVKSPSYSLVEPYKTSSLYFYHFDFYRFSDPREWLDAGLRDHFNDESVVFVEWPEQAGGLLPVPDWHIALSVEGDGRRAVVSAHSARGSACLNALRAQPATGAAG